MTGRHRGRCPAGDLTAPGKEAACHCLCASVGESNFTNTEKPSPCVALLVDNSLHCSVNDSAEYPTTTTLLIKLINKTSPLTCDMAHPTSNKSKLKEKKK